MTQYSPVTTEVKEMFGSIAPKYDLANTVLSFGSHHLWKRWLVRLLPQSSNLKVLDLCTGTGDLLPILESRFGKASGADFCKEMLDLARDRYSKRGKIFELHQADAMNLSFEDSSFDIVTVSFGVRNFKDLSNGLSEIFRIIKPAGYLLVLEFGQPQGIVFGPLYRFYSKYIIPIIGGFLTGNKTAYTYLPETSKAFPCGEKFCENLTAAGFKDIIAVPYTFGIAFAYRATKP